MAAGRPQELSRSIIVYVPDSPLDHRAGCVRPPGGAMVGPGRAIRMSRATTRAIRKEGLNPAAVMVAASRMCPAASRAVSWLGPSKPNPSQYTKRA